MDYDQEATYIESIDTNNIPANFNRELGCFHGYCKMQYRGAVADENWKAACRIVAVILATMEKFNV